MLGSHPKRKLPKRSYWNRSYQTLKIWNQEFSPW
jgi:hypothetical protein